MSDNTTPATAPAPRRTGRPRKGDEPSKAVVTIALQAGERDAFVALAREQGLTVSAFGRLAIVEVLAAYGRT